MDYDLTPIYLASSTMEEMASPEVELTRTRTMVQGGCCCTFGFWIKNSSIAK